MSIQHLAGSAPGLAAFLAVAALALVLDALIAVLIGLTAFWNGACGATSRAIW